MNENKVLEEKIKILEGQIISLCTIQNETFKMMDEAIKELKQRIKVLEQ